MAGRKEEKDRPRGAAPAPTDGAAAVAAPPAADEAGGGGVWRYIRPTTLAKLVVWAVLQVIFYRLEFGLVFFIASCFYWVWDSMSSSSASTVDGEERVSAYSVFNRGVNALPGTLNANEFDNMMRGGFAPPPGGEEEKRSAAGRVDDNYDEEEDQAIQRAAMASLKHRKAATEQQKTKAKKPPPATTTKARTYASSSSSSSSVAAPKPLVFDSDLQALMRSVAKP